MHNCNLHKCIISLCPIALLLYCSIALLLYCPIVLLPYCNCTLFISDSVCHSARLNNLLLRAEN